MRFPRSYEEIEAISNARSRNGSACDIGPPHAPDAKGEVAKSAIQ
jgi:hypothetical protein